jgi:hypothetical protein
VRTTVGHVIDDKNECNATVAMMATGNKLATNWQRNTQQQQNHFQFVLPSAIYLELASYGSHGLTHGRKVIKANLR